MTDPVPSKDLLTRLRTGYLCEIEGCKCHAIEARSGCQCAEAADEIERLQARVKELEERETKLRCLRCGYFNFETAQPSDAVPPPSVFRCAYCEAPFSSAAATDAHIVLCTARATETRPETVTVQTPVDWNQVRPVNVTFRANDGTQLWPPETTEGGQK